MNHDQFIQLMELLHQNRIFHISDIANHFVVDDAIVRQWIESLNHYDNLILTQVGEKLFLNKSLDLLKQQSIKQHLNETFQQRIAELSIHTSLVSTNEYLRKQIYLGEGALICLAEHQTSGRGRRGKQWVSPFGQNIYLSLLTRCRVPNSLLGVVSLVVGIAVVEALKLIGADQLKLKWPNDIYWKDHKLAGILIEAKEITDNYGDLVIGVGLNVYMDRINASAINQSWTALNQILDTEINRNIVAAQLIQCILAKIQLFEEQGFNVFIEQWQELDYLNGKDVRVSGIARELNGIALGITPLGELLIKTQDKTFTVNAGEVSVRLHYSGEK